MCATRSGARTGFSAARSPRCSPAAKIPKARIDGLAVASFTLAPDTAVGLTQHLGLTLRWLDHVPMGGASGIVSIRRAARAVQEWRCRDRGLHCRRHQPHRQLSPQHRDLQPVCAGRGLSLRLGRAECELRASSPPITCARYGATREDFGKLCVAQRNNALKNPLALFKKPLTLGRVSQRAADRRSAAAVRLRDAVRRRRGLSGDAARRPRAALGLRYARLLGAIERHNAFPDDPVQYRGGWAMDRDDLYAQAGVGPDDIDFLAKLRRLSGHQRAAVRGSRLLPRRARARLSSAPTAFEADGSFPFNTSGGQLSVGQAGAAGGHLGIVEAIRQLTGQTLGAQVAGCAARPGLRASG